MKHLIIFFVSLISFTASNGQFFSGELNYSFKIIPKKKGLNVDSLIQYQPGTSSKYLITQHYYKSIYYRDGKESYSYTYHDDTKRMYDAEAQNDYISFRDARKGDNTRIRSTIYKDSVRTIAGHKCFMVERIYNTYISKNYYAVDLKIDPETYQGHQVADWYNQIKEVDGSLSLGSINEYPTYIEEYMVTKIITREVKKEEFALGNKTMVASPTALDKQVMFDFSPETMQCIQDKIKSAPKKNTKKYRCISVVWLQSKVP